MYAYKVHVLYRSSWYVVYVCTCALQGNIDQTMYYYYTIYCVMKPVQHLLGLPVMLYCLVPSIGSNYLHSID